jgi:hypothetical protein
MPVSSLATSLVTSIVSAIIESAMAPSGVPANAGYVRQEMIRPFTQQTGAGWMRANLRTRQLWIDNRRYQAAPALQIRDARNFIIPMGYLPARASPVRYQLDLMGNVWRLWLLSPAETAALARAGRLSSPPWLPTTLPASVAGNDTTDVDPSTPSTLPAEWPEDLRLPGG